MRPLELITEGDGKANRALGGMQRRGPGTSIAQRHVSRV